VITSESRPIPSDPVLHGLSEFLSFDCLPTFVAEMLERVTGDDVDVESGKVSYLRFKPTRDCVAQWTFSSSTGRPIFVSAKLFSDETGAAIATDASFRESAYRARIAAGAQVELYEYLPNRRVLLQAFPLDAKLCGLPLATDAASVKDVFARALGPPGGPIQLVDTTPVSYMAWHRCVLRYTVDLEGRQTNYFAKLFSDDRGAAMLTQIQALKRRLDARGSPWVIPTPLTYYSEARMLVVEALADASELRLLFKHALEDSSLIPEIKRQCAAAAAGLSAFREVPVDGLPIVAPSDLVDGLERKSRGLDEVAPALAQRIGLLLRGLTVEAAHLPAESMALTHGAFRHTQMLVCGDRLGLLDLDNLRVSGASADPGEFLAYLDSVVAKQPHLATIAGDCEGAFVDDLIAHGRPSLRWLSWYRAAADVKHAQRCFFSLPPRWPETVEALLSSAERCLVGSRRC